VQRKNERSYCANRKRMSWTDRDAVDNGCAGAGCATNVVKRDGRGLEGAFWASKAHVERDPEKYRLFHPGASRRCSGESHQSMTCSH